MAEASTEALKKHRRALVSLSDFFEASSSLNAIHFLGEINENERKHARCGLMGYAVVAYVRPFTANYTDGGKSTKSVSLDELGMELDAKLKSLHEFILVVRKQVVAHSDFEAKPLHATAPGQAVGRGTFQFIEAIDLNDFRHLVGYAVTQCMAYVSAMESQHGEALYEADPTPEFFVFPKSKK